MKKKNEQGFAETIAVVLVSLVCLVVIYFFLCAAEKKEKIFKNSREYKIQNCITNGKYLLKAIYDNPDNISGTPTTGSPAAEIINRCYELHK